MQTTSHLLMIRPVNFGFNAETAVNNSFQQKGNQRQAASLAEKEFDQFAELLIRNGIDLTIISDTPEPHTPDSIFPNNWISFHSDGSIVLYPMFAPNRRAERKPHVLEAIAKKFAIGQQIDLTGFEKDSRFLEGTGSKVLDRVNRIAYACLSPRTDREVLLQFCEQMGYKAIFFHATDSGNQAIYHTNVMMCVADAYAVVCVDSIQAASERAALVNSLESTGKKIITISLDQMNHFAGNMLQVHNHQGQRFLVMSTQAYESLDPTQKQLILEYNPILHSSLQTIEVNGGGSARCMLAEVFLPLINSPHS